MFRKTLLTAKAALLLSASMGFAATDYASRLANAYLEHGYTHIEVETGPTQTRVEAYKEGMKVEVVYDNETGEILTRTVEPGVAEGPGDDVEFNVESHDFVEPPHDDDGEDEEDDDEEDDEDDEDDEDEDDEDEEEEGDDEEGDDEEDEEEDDEEGEHEEARD
jgi:phosphopantothenoylcysteine synthetase/decarboxylase